MRLTSSKLRTQRPLKGTQSDVTELNWHGLVIDELTNAKQQCITVGTV